MYFGNISAKQDKVSINIKEARFREGENYLPLWKFNFKNLKSKDLFILVGNEKNNNNWF